MKIGLNYISVRGKNMKPLDKQWDKFKVHIIWKYEFYIDYECQYSRFYNYKRTNIDQHYATTATAFL